MRDSPQKRLSVVVFVAALVAFAVSTYSYQGQYHLPAWSFALLNQHLSCLVTGSQSYCSGYRAYGVLLSLLIALSFIGLWWNRTYTPLLAGLNRMVDGLLRWIRTGSV
jgi:hypothetical protein